MTKNKRRGSTFDKIYWNLCLQYFSLSIAKLTRLINKNWRHSRRNLVFIWSFFKLNDFSYFFLTETDYEIEWAFSFTINISRITTTWLSFQDSKFSCWNHCQNYAYNACNQSAWKWNSQIVNNNKFLLNISFLSNLYMAIKFRVKIWSSKKS